MRTTAHPPVAADDIEKLRSALVAALGAEAVTDDADALVEFRDPYWVRGSDDFDASLAVAPTSTEQVQQVVRLANEHGVPLWSFGQGRNNTYGGPAPRSRLGDRQPARDQPVVPRVNEELCYAVVEPWGCASSTWTTRCSRRAAGVAGRSPSGWGSVVGNTLDYGRGYTPYGDHPANVCGMEVVLPDGEGAAHGHGRSDRQRRWHAYQYSFGPSLDRIFIQQLRDRHEHGRLAHAVARRAAVVRRRVGGGRGARRDGRRPARAHARGRAAHLPDPLAAAG